jgi:hypothetical protein
MKGSTFNLQRVCPTPNSSTFIAAQSYVGPCNLPVSPVHRSHLLSHITHEAWAFVPTYSIQAVWHTSYYQRIYMPDVAVNKQDTEGLQSTTSTCSRTHYRV